MASRADIRRRDYVDCISTTVALEYCHGTDSFIMKTLKTRFNCMTITAYNHLNRMIMTHHAEINRVSICIPPPSSYWCVFPFFSATVGLFWPNLMAGRPLELRLCGHVPCRFLAIGSVYPGMFLSVCSRHTTITCFLALYARFVTQVFVYFFCFVLFVPFVPFVVRKKAGTGLLRQSPRLPVLIMGRSDW